MIERETMQKNELAVEEERKFLATYGVNPDVLLQTEEKQDGYESNKLHPFVWIGVGTAFLANVAVLLSLPQAIRGRGKQVCRFSCGSVYSRPIPSFLFLIHAVGAPYLPTFQRSMDAMFSQLQSEPALRRRLLKGNDGTTFQFVDLGSGDGRVVFRAAREGLFSQCIGYEINPLLHGFAVTRRWIAPRYWSTTQFQCRNIWNVDLRQADVVAVVRASAPFLGFAAFTAVLQWK